VLGILILTGVKTAKYFGSDLLRMRSQENTNWKVAQGLQAIGIRSGDRVSVIASKGEVHWARIAGARIVAELPLGKDYLFWAADPSAQDKVFAAFASTGSCIAVAKDPPPSATSRGWLRLSDTNYYVHSLSKDSVSPPQ